jgi:hypothetical protein
MGADGDQEGAAPFEQRATVWYTLYRGIDMNDMLTVQADEIGSDFIETLKTMYKSERIVIVPETEFNDLTREKHNREYMGKLARSFQELEEGKGIVMSMDQLAALEHE